MSSNRILAAGLDRYYKQLQAGVRKSAPVAKNYLKAFGAGPDSADRTATTLYFDALGNTDNLANAATPGINKGMDTGFAIEELLQKNFKNQADRATKQGIMPAPAFNGREQLDPDAAHRLLTKGIGSLERKINHRAYRYAQMLTKNTDKL